MKRLLFGKIAKKNMNWKNFWADLQVSLFSWLLVVMWMTGIALLAEPFSTHRGDVMPIERLSQLGKDSVSVPNAEVGQCLSVSIYMLVFVYGILCGSVQVFINMPNIKG